MKDLKLPRRSGGVKQNRIAFQGGSYSLMMTAVVLALLVVVNILVSALPTNLTKYDISASKLYSITSNTKVVVNALQDDVTIYWIVQSGKEDQIIENLSSSSDFSTQCLVYYLNKYNFTVHDQTIFDYLRENNPEYLVEFPELSETDESQS